MAQFNPKNIGPAALGFAASIALIALGLIGTAYTLGAFTDTPQFATNRSSGLGLTFVVGGGVLALLSAGKLFERDWGEVEVPTLAPDAYLEALTHAEPPSWTCTRCRVVAAGRGLGTCIHCDSGTEFYAIDTTEDLQMILASMG